MSADVLDSVRQVALNRAEALYAFEEAIRAAVAAGATHSAVAQAAGLTRGRVSQLVGAGPAPGAPDAVPPAVRRQRPRAPRGPPR